MPKRCYDIVVNVRGPGGDGDGDGDGADIKYDPCDPPPAPDPDPYCGDGHVDYGEQCDDGKNNGKYSCTNSCTIRHYCGDGVVDAGEACDKGGLNGTGSCTTSCTIRHYCGDGVVDAGEACDTGAANGTGTCTASCTLAPRCGDGHVDPGEACDNGNTNGTGTCTASCTIAPTVDCSTFDNEDHEITDNPYGDRGYQNADFGFCDENTHKAYHDIGHQCAKPIADWVCAVVRAADIGDPMAAHSLAKRCVNEDKKMCRIGTPGDPNDPWAGGEAGTRRSNHIQSGACYATAASGDTPGIDEVRCCCGCFPGDVQVLSNWGYLPMNRLEHYTDKPLRLAVAVTADTDELKASEPVQMSDIVVGPEKKPVIDITTDNGATLTVTDMHPVLTVVNGNVDMVQAHELKVGDVLFTESGEATTITELGQHTLPADDNNVFNVYVPSTTGDGHVIIANKLRTGDRRWQDTLSARGSFEYGLTEAAAP
jgi:cysteine-rich repeat protein